MGVIANLGSWLQPKFSPRKEDISPFVSTLPQRPSATLRLPQKRDDTENSEEISLPSQHASQSKQTLLNFKPSSQPETPSPIPSLKRGNVEVVIPSPSQQQRKLFKSLKPIETLPTGFSDRRFPTNTDDEEKAARRAYPKARNVDRSVVSFALAPKPMPYTSITPVQALRYELNQKLKRINGPEVSFDMDDEKVATLSANFGFLNEYKLQDGITRADPGFNAGCTCKGPCDPETCDCVEREEDSEKLISTYRTSASGQVVLGPDFLKRKRHPRILECNEGCGCKGRCWNTVVQRGRNVRLQIFDTGGRGLGMHP
jgi:histone-lysine N-methyltransferase SUV39H